LNKSILIPVITIPVLLLITGMIILPTYQEQQELRDAFFETYAFEQRYYVMKQGTNDYVDDAKIVFTWYSDGEILDPKYWYLNCISSDCNGRIEEFEWEEDTSRPITVVPSENTLIQFSMFEESGHMINHTEFQLANSNLYNIEDLRNFGIDKVVYTINATHLRDHYHEMEGNILPSITFFVYVESNEQD